MLVHINQARQQAAVIDGQAHIVISLDAQGNASLRGYFNGSTDSIYAALSDRRLLNTEVPKLLTELREQLQSLAGSSVTA